MTLDQQQVICGGGLSLTLEVVGQPRGQHDAAGGVAGLAGAGLGVTVLHLDGDAFELDAGSAVAAGGALRGTGDQGCRARRAHGVLDHGDARVLAEIGEARQGEGGEDAEQDDDHDQLDQGEAALVAWHDCLLVGEYPISLYLTLGGCRS